MQLNNIFTIVFLTLLFSSIILKIGLDIINYRHRRKFAGVIPEELNDFVDQEKLIKINQYSNTKLSFSLIEYFFDQVLILVILFTGLIPLYYTFLLNRFHNNYLIGLFFFGSYYLLTLILEVPFSLYFHFVIEKKFQFNKMTLKIWFDDLFKRIILTAILGIIILLPLIFFLYTFKSYWWLLLWLFFFLFSLLMQVIYPTLIAPLFNKFKPLENQSLKQKIEQLLQDSGLKSDGVFEMDASKRSSHSNAYFTGLGKSKRIVLFDSLIQKHTEDEITAVLAHEIGHYKHKHILKGLLVSMVSTFIALFLSYFFMNFPHLYRAFGFTDPINLEQTKLIGLFLLMIISGPLSFFITPVGAFFSRKHEYQADQYAVKTVKTAEPLITALKKLNIDNLSNLYPADIYAFFYYSHPPLFKRIRALKVLEANFRSTTAEGL